jgi:hypothetical protein
MAQAEALYNSFQESDYNRFILDAKMRGVDVEKEVEESKTKQTFMFQDPKEYEKLPEEERERLTNEMMGKHRLQFDKD